VKVAPLVIRADAGCKMGTGHVMRCLALAEAWHDRGGNAVLVTARHHPGLDARLAAAGIETAHVSALPGSSEDARETVEIAQRCQAAWVAVDGYHFLADYQRYIKRSGLSLLMLDDYGHAERYWGDVVLNQNLHAEEILYRSREPYTRLLLGTRYALLRREFRNRQGPPRAIPRVARRLLITMGGADPDNVTLRVLRAVSQLGIDGLETVVVLGRSNPHLKQVRAFAAECTMTIRLQVDVDDMAELMAWSDAAITAGGSTVWELAFLGVPSITLALADNQTHSANLLARRGISPTLGWGPIAESTDVAKEIHRFLLDRNVRERCSRRAVRLVDGLGASRVVDQLMYKGSVP